MKTEGCRVDPAGVWLSPTTDQPLDVSFDGRRIWSFWSQRDTKDTAQGRFASWPSALTRYLDGVADVEVRVHGSTEVLFAEELRFGDSTSRIAIVDQRGEPLALDKSLRLTTQFEHRTAAQMAPLLDSMQVVIAALEDAGLEPFLAYGSLLGAVRQGGLIGHDNDADLGYVSHATHPADAVIESFRIQRRLVEAGFTVVRYSGLAFRVDVVETDGTVRGLDVFGGFFLQDQLFLMGEVGTPFRRDWIWPRTRVAFEGRDFPAPAKPEELLVAKYGPSWKVPDPAYKFSTPDLVVRQLNGWFRGTRVGRLERGQRIGERGLNRKRKGPSKLARWMHAQGPADAAVIDIGCGRGWDAVWLAEQGHPSVGLDYLPFQMRPAKRLAGAQGLDVSFDWVNLSELRSTLAVAARYALTHPHAHLMSRGLAEQTDRAGRWHLLLFARTVLASHGSLWLEVNATTNRYEVALSDLSEMAARLGASVHVDRGAHAEGQAAEPTMVEVKWTAND